MPRAGSVARDSFIILVNNYSVWGNTTQNIVIIGTSVEDYEILCTTILFTLRYWLVFTDDLLSLMAFTYLS